MNKKKLTEKIKRIEALFAVATTDGERDSHHYDTKHCSQQGTFDSFCGKGVDKR